MRTYEQRHAKRYAMSLAALLPHLQPGMIVLECGERSTFADTLERECKVEVRATGEADLRYWLTASGWYADAVICMEVIEHIHDQERTKPTEWTGSGTTHLLAGIRSVLAPGGMLFLTTPNAASLNVLHKVLHQQPPMVYRPHVREYGPHELAKLVKEAGFTGINVTAHDVWDNDCMTGGEVKRLREMLAQLGYRTDCRGEDLFLTAYKPKEAAA